jgi:hypothetical protein
LLPALAVGKGNARPSGRLPKSDADGSLDQQPSGFWSVAVEFDR